MQRSTVSKLMQLWTEAMIAFGLAIAFIPWVRNDLFSWIAEGDTAMTDDFSQAARDYLAFNQALVGAVTVGLGMAGFWLARVPIARGEAWGWNAFVCSVASWFVVDNVCSIALGFPRNAVFNTLLVAPLVPLLWMTRPTATVDEPAPRDVPAV